MSTASDSLVKTQCHSSSHHHIYQRLPFELQAEIFVQCMPSVELRDFRRFIYNKGGMYPHHIRARLALVCRTWYTVVYNEPRVWTTMIFLESSPHPETVSLWIKKSMTMPLVVYVPNWWFEMGSDSLFSMLREEMWRIRCLFCNISPKTNSDFSALFPLNVSTNAPMLQSLAIHRTHRSWFNQGTSELGDIHCPELRTLFLCCFDTNIKSLTVRPLKNIHQVTIDRDDPPTENITCLKLLEALPNLVSLSW